MLILAHLSYVTQRSQTLVRIIPVHAPRRGGARLHISKSTLHNVRPVTRAQQVFLEEIIFIAIMNGWR